MGANAQTAVPAFTTGQVLTAAQMTEVNTGIPVFADTTARDAAFGGSGEKVLAQGQYAYIEANSQLQVYTGAAWVAAGGGLVRVGGGALSGASVAFTNVFSATYDTYLIVASNLTAASNSWLDLQFGATTSGYYRSLNFGNYTTGSIFNELIYYGASGGGGVIQVSNPFLAKRTTVSCPNAIVQTSGGYGSYQAGFLDNTTSYTGFTVSGVTFTAGTINIYGYSLS